MSDITHTSPVVTEDKLTEFYEDIKPFLGCPAYITQEGSENYYTSNEKVIGRWTNGKPIYQKIIENWVTSDDTTDKYIDVSSYNIDSMIKLEGYYKTNDGSYSPLARVYVSTPGQAVAGCIYYSYRASQNQLMIRPGNGGWFNATGNYGYRFIMQYTKTTDSAATTVVEDPNEYSTTEKIIGKWIDGKPIYQKTIDCGTLVNGENRIAHNISNLGNLIDGSGSILSTNGGVPIPYSSASTQYNLYLNVDATYVILGTTNNLWNGAHAAVTLKYLKTTD